MEVLYIISIFDVLNIKDMVSIYGLLEPITNKLVYIGQTTDDDLIHYLKSKYWKLNEVEKGDRKTNRLFEFLKINRNGVSIFLIDTASSKKDGDNLERFYIKKYRDEGFDLLNEADGGFGGNTYKYKTEEEIKEIGNKIRNKLKGKPKPYSQREKLSTIRKGINNPAAKKTEIEVLLGDEMVFQFNYPFELNNHFCNKYIWGNALKSIRKKGFYIYKSKDGNIYKIQLKNS